MQNRKLLSSVLTINYQISVILKGFRPIILPKRKCSRQSGSRRSKLRSRAASPVRTIHTESSIKIVHWPRCPSSLLEYRVLRPRCSQFLLQNFAAVFVLLFFLTKTEQQPIDGKNTLSWRYENRVTYWCASSAAGRRKKKNNMGARNGMMTTAGKNFIYYMK